VLQRTPGDTVRALNIAVDEWDNTVREFPPAPIAARMRKWTNIWAVEEGGVQSYITESGINAASLDALILSNGA
jgi:hypothetical protein